MWTIHNLDWTQCYLCLSLLIVYFWIRLRFSISAQAIYLSGRQVALRFLLAYSIWLLFLPSPLWSAVKCTLTITAPSFRCRLTFLPIKDLALLALKLSIFTIPRLDQRFCSSIVGKSVVFPLLSECTVGCFHFCRFLSKGFCNVPSCFPRYAVGIFRF